MMLSWSSVIQNSWLVVWHMNVIVPSIGNSIIPTDELIFFRGVGLNHQPDTILAIINHIITIDINHILTRYINQPIVGRWLNHQPAIVNPPTSPCLLTCKPSSRGCWSPPRRRLHPRHQDDDFAGRRVRGTEKGQNKQQEWGILRPNKVNGVFYGALAPVQCNYGVTVWRCTKHQELDVSHYQR